MRILGAMSVRDAADVIEAAVRHNLHALDGLVVLVHGASDTTPAILDALAAEGLALRIVRDDDPVGLDPRRSARLVAEAFAWNDPDWVIVLRTADFLKPPSRTVLEQVLAAAEPGASLALDRQTYIPDFAAPADDDALAPLRNARRLAREAHPARRAAIPRALAANATAADVAAHPPIAHAAASSPAAPAPTSPASLTIAHVPVRSAAQLMSDGTVARLAAMAAGTPEAQGSWIESVYAEIRAGRPLTAMFLDAAAVNAGVPRAAWVDAASVARVDDPFLAAIELRHAPKRAPFPLARVLALGEYLARNEAARIQSQLLRGPDAGTALGRNPPR